MENLYEGLIYTRDVHSTVIGFEKWENPSDYISTKIDVTNQTPYIKVFIDGKIDKQQWSDTVRYFNNSGYVPALIVILWALKQSSYTEQAMDKLIEEGEKNYFVSFFAKYDQEIDSSQFDNLYHVTKSIYVDKIKKIGFIPKSKAKTETHPPRIYLLTDINKAQQLKKTFIRLDKGESKTEDYSLITIKPKRMKLFIDPSFKSNGNIDAVYVMENIPPEYIKKIEKI